MRKLLVSGFISIILFTSCTKDPVDPFAPDPVITYSITDTMRLSAFTINNFPEFFNNYNNKTYSRQTNKVKSNYQVEGADVLIHFEDTSAPVLSTALTIKFSNKTLLNISGTYAAQNQDVFYKWQQKLTSSASVFSANYIKADNSIIQVYYDDKTKTISGSITKLRYPFGIYVPFYEPGSTITPQRSDDIYLSSDGSFRQHTITFQHIKSF
jgi:hypothetical protein